MRSQIFASLRRRPLLTVLLFLVCAVGLIWTTFLVRAGTSAHRTALVPVPGLPAAQSDKNKERLPIALSTLTRFGFQPAVLKLPEGKCLIVVRNLTGNENLHLELSAVRDGKLVSEKPDPKKPFWEKPLNLREGEYTLSVAENPRWSLSLSVSPAGKK